MRLSWRWARRSRWRISWPCRPERAATGPRLYPRALTVNPPNLFLNLASTYANLWVILPDGRKHVRTHPHLNLDFLTSLFLLPDCTHCTMLEPSSCWVMHCGKLSFCYSSIAYNLILEFAFLCFLQVTLNVISNPNAVFFRGKSKIEIEELLRMQWQIVFVIA